MHHIIVIIIAIAAGLAGSYIGQNGFYDKPDARVSQAKKETIKEVLPESAITEVADKMKLSVVSVVATKELKYVMNDPYNFFFQNPLFENDPFFERFFGNKSQNEQPEQKNSPEPQVREEKRQVAAGTGFVISKDGLILTNKHVVSDPEAEYTVLFADSSEYKAEVVTRDPSNDIAIIRITNAKKNQEFKPAELIANKDEVNVGQMVIAIGNALGQFDNTVTVGVISAKGRDLVAGDGSTGGSEKLSKLLQTDAAINPGNSGGPLVSLSGKVLGVNTAVAGGAQGIGFAIPVDQQRIDTILKQIKEHGKIIRPFLGIRYQRITPELNQEVNLGVDHGAWVKGDNDLPAVIANTPAAKAGLKSGDIVLM